MNQSEASSEPLPLAATDQSEDTAAGGRSDTVKDRPAESSEGLNEPTAEEIRAMADAEVLKLAAMAAERDHYLDIARRAQAEFDNYKKRIERQRHEEARYASASFAREIITAVDNLERALLAAKSTRDFDGTV